MAVETFTYELPKMFGYFALVGRKWQQLVAKQPLSTALQRGGNASATRFS